MDTKQNPAFLYVMEVISHFSEMQYSSVDIAFLAQEGLDIVNFCDALESEGVPCFVDGHIVYFGSKDRTVPLYRLSHAEEVKP
jgi:hypothetical protein